MTTPYEESFFLDALSLLDRVWSEINDDEGDARSLKNEIIEFLKKHKEGFVAPPEDDRQFEDHPGNQ